MDITLLFTMQFKMLKNRRSQLENTTRGVDMQKRLETYPITIVEFCLDMKLFKDEDNVRWHISLDFKYGFRKLI
jgi:hypothetical protein